MKRRNFILSSLLAAALPVRSVGSPVPKFKGSPFFSGRCVGRLHARRICSLDPSSAESNGKWRRRGFLRIYRFLGTFSRSSDEKNNPEWLGVSVSETCSLSSHRSFWSRIKPCLLVPIPMRRAFLSDRQNKNSAIRD